MTPDGFDSPDGSTYSEPEASAVPPLKLAFESWFGGQGYDDQGRFDMDEMEFAFEAGAEAERDLAARQPAPGDDGTYEPFIAASGEREVREIVVPPEQPAPGLTQSAYLYHCKFGGPGGDEYGLFWRREDADEAAANRAGEGYTQVLGMAILGDRPEPQAEPAPLPLGIALAALECIRQSHEPGTLAHDLARKALDDLDAAGGVRQPEVPS